MRSRRSSRVRLPQVSSVSEAEAAEKLRGAVDFKTVLKPYKGDLFGSSDKAGSNAGLMYRSRFGGKPKHGSSKRRGNGAPGNKARGGGRRVSISLGKEGNGSGDGDGSTGGGATGAGAENASDATAARGATAVPANRNAAAAKRSLTASGAGSRRSSSGIMIPNVPEVALTKHVKAMRHCATALCSLSWKTDACFRLMKEDAVSALFQVAMTEDTETKLLCATTLVNLVQHPPLRKEMLAQQLVPALNLLVQAGHPRINQDCVAAICHAADGDAENCEKVLADGGVHVLSTVLNAASTKGNRDTLALTAVAVLGLSCVQHRTSLTVQMDSLIETILEAVDAAMDDINEQVCLRALCNACCNRHSQPKAVELGAVRLLNKLARSTAAKTRFLSVYALALLCESKLGRRTVFEQRAVHTLILLAGTTGQEIQQQCAIALCRLAADDIERQREILVSDGAIDAFLALIDMPDALTRARCTAALCRLCSSASCIPKLLQAGLVPAVQRFAREHRGDEFTARNCALALANLLYHPSSHDTALRQGAVQVAIGLGRSRFESTKQSAAFALFNLSCRVESTPSMMALGTTPAVITMLGEAEAMETKKMCAATISNMTAGDPSSIEDALQSASGAIVPLTQLLQEGEALASSAAAYNLSGRPEHGRQLLKNGIMGSLVRLCRSSDSLTRRLAVSVVCRLSMHPELRVEMWAVGLVEALIALSRERDLDMQHRAATTLCNMASEAGMRALLIEAGAATALVALSSVHNEEIRQGCAAALCDLAAEPTLRGNLVENGAVQALVILGMVASSEEVTEVLCAKGLFNFLQDEDKREKVLADGGLYGLSVLAKNGTSEMRYICAVAMWNLSSDTEVGQKHIMTPAVLKALIELSHSGVPTCERACARALFNLASVESWRTDLALAGVVEVFNRLAGGDESVHELCVTGLALLSAHPISRDHIVGQHADAFVFNPEGGAWPTEDQEFAAALMLYNLSWYEETRFGTLQRGAVQAVSNLVHTHDAETRKIAIQSLYNLACDSQNLVPLMTPTRPCGPPVVIFPLRYVILEMRRTTEYRPDGYMLQLCAHILFNLSTVAENHVALVQAGAVELMHAIWADDKMEGDAGDARDIVVKALLNVLASKVNTSFVLRDGGGKMLIGFTHQQNFSALMSRRRSLSHHADAHVPADKKLFRLRISAAMRNLLCAAGNAENLVKDGVVDVLLILAQSPVKEVVKNVSAGLISISHNSKLNAVTKNPVVTKIIGESMMASDSGLAQEAAFLSPTLLAEIEEESWNNGSRGNARLGRADPYELFKMCIELRMTEANAPHLNVELDSTDSGCAWFAITVSFKMKMLSFPETSLHSRLMGDAELDSGYDEGNARPSGSSVFAAIPYPSSIKLMSKRDHHYEMEAASNAGGSKRRASVLRHFGKPLRRENAIAGETFYSLLRSHKKVYRWPQFKAREAAKEKEVEEKMAMQAAAAAAAMSKGGSGSARNLHELLNPLTKPTFRRAQTLPQKGQRVRRHSQLERSSLTGSASASAVRRLSMSQGNWMKAIKGSREVAKAGVRHRKSVSALPAVSPSKRSKPAANAFAISEDAEEEDDNEGI